MIISKKFSFEASHILPKHPGKCSRLHGHSWALTVSVTGPINPDSGFVVDYSVLKYVVDKHIIEKLDHTHLGYGEAHTPDRWHPYFGPNFYPSSENLVVAIARVLQPLIQEINQNVRLIEVKLSETCTSEATWRAE